MVFVRPVLCAEVRKFFLGLLTTTTAAGAPDHCCVAMRLRTLAVALLATAGLFGVLHNLAATSLTHTSGWLSGGSGGGGGFSRGCTGSQRAGCDVVVGGGVRLVSTVAFGASERVSGGRAPRFYSHAERILPASSLARHWARDWRALALTQVHHGSRLSDSCEDDGEALAPSGLALEGDV